ncbi:hypothetical protein G4B88_011566 [Cannabis sativa]|uniref:MLO-like protein n=1 Tax=Cannabis sativa TaxID=3483 RepID=A0A7J6GHA7_CANSA|nr:hypothetical protein G4B88_011566 [Cannabis sativa]
MADLQEERSLEETPTWAVAVVVFVLIIISIIIEHVIHLIEKWLESKHKKALQEALEKIKLELMLLGFISLLLTIFQDYIADICIPKSAANTWHPCQYQNNEEKKAKESDKTKSKTIDYCSENGKVALVSKYGIHQLHIFIFVLALFHIIYCITTLAIGRTKMRKWKVWEDETKKIEYIYSNDPERFRFTRDTSFGRRHLNIWSQSPISLWIVCFFRQFFGSVTKVDYMTLRHGFVMAHLAPEIIITKMGLSIQERGDVVKGAPLVQPGDDLFWFGRPKLMLFLIHLVLFQNAFQLAFFAWSTYEFTLNTCFHEKIEDIIIRISMGILIQVLCSYVTLPLYALVTQMGSTMRPVIFNDRVATALKNWHHSAKTKNKKHNRNSETNSPFSSRPATPTYGMSPVHLLQNYRSTATDGYYGSPRMSNVENDYYEPEGTPSPNNGPATASEIQMNNYEVEKDISEEGHPMVQEQSSSSQQNEVKISLSHFSFRK